MYKYYTQANLGNKLASSKFPQAGLGCRPGPPSYDHPEPVVCYGDLAGPANLPPGFADADQRDDGKHSLPQRLS
jgi:hypothetical protein